MKSQKPNTVRKKHLALTAKDKSWTSRLPYSDKDEEFHQNTEVKIMSKTQRDTFIGKKALNENKPSNSQNVTRSNFARTESKISLCSRIFKKSVQVKRK